MDRKGKPKGMALAKLQEREGRRGRTEEEDYDRLAGTARSNATLESHGMHPDVAAIARRLLFKVSK